MRVAALDLGTNSFRLLVADVEAVPSGAPRPAGAAPSGVAPSGAAPSGAAPSGAAPTGPVRLVDVVRRTRIVRLGEGVDATGRLSAAAVARTLAVAEGFGALLAEYRPAAVRAVATSAVRDARDDGALLAGLRDRIGVVPDVLTGRDEALLSFGGAAPELAGRGGPLLVVDIGGGSTELVLGPPPDDPDGAAPVAVSVDIGSVRLTERVLRGDPPTGAEVERATELVDSALDEAAATVPLREARTLVGLAASVTTVAALALGLDRYDSARVHLARVPADRVSAVTRDLLASTREQRSRLGPVESGRADVLAAGALILHRVLARTAPTLAVPEVTASEHDLLDGVARSLLPTGSADRHRSGPPD